MSSKFVLAVLALTFVTSSYANLASIAGKYSAAKEVPVYYETKDTCKENGGSWEEEMEACFVPTSDDAVITKLSRTKYNLKVNTFGNNFHSCEFEGKATLSNGTLTSQVQAEEYDYVTDQIVNVTCEVKAQISSDGKTLSVSTNNHCQSFCGANAWLEVDGLSKVNN